MWRVDDLKAALPEREVREAVESWFDIGGRPQEQGKHVLRREARGDEALGRPLSPGRLRSSDETPVVVARLASSGAKQAWH